MSRPSKTWNPGIKSPWLTRAETADYMRWSVKTVDRYLVHMQKEPVPGKLRFTVITTETKIKMIRVLAEDVYALCPDPLAA